MAAGYNSRLQRAAFVDWEALPVTSRGFASILRLVAVVASCWVLAGLFGPPLKRPPLYRAVSFIQAEFAAGATWHFWGLAEW